MPRRPYDPLPDFIAPELALLVKRAPDGDAWIHDRFQLWRRPSTTGTMARLLSNRD